MARKIVAIHGIGDNKPGWSEPMRLNLDIPKEDWIEFNYEDLMDRSFFHKVVVTGTKIYLTHTYGPEASVMAEVAEDYINDIISYFVMNGTRLEIQVRLKGLLKENPDAVLIGHSLGSVVAYETLKNFDVRVHSMFTFGSPLSKGLVRKFLRIPNQNRPDLINWINVWSMLDPVSGKINNLGCLPADQVHIHNSHALLPYANSQVEKIRKFYLDGMSVEAVSGSND